MPSLSPPRVTLLRWVLSPDWSVVSTLTHHYPASQIVDTGTPKTFVDYLDGPGK